ncbi:HAD family phosphatase [Desulfitobacterium sp.]|uniref:HAD family hydrolase n=1 Tax=Desulfitobacterium sp. TaxID=49981 RepID=UPI002B218ED9|nr:HAD family phosphatase [Desulfitobacterium sp.]MEA4902880.1 HAD family phosphatase [Desulfitobacterium sp.]
MITGAIFDLDGTLLDSMPIWDKAGEIFLHTIGIEAEPGLAKIMFCMSMTEGAEFLKERYHLDLDVDAIIAGINHTIENFYFYQVQLKEGVEQFLKDMRLSGIKMVGATSCDRQVFARALERLKVIHCFDRISTCTEIGSGKEKPDIYLAAAEHMGTLPKDTWVFEDALFAIQSAKNAGFRTVGVFDASNLENLDEIKKASDFYLEKLDTFSIFLAKASSK